MAAGFAQEALDAAGTTEAIDAVRVRYLGRKGALTGVMRNISQLPKEDRPSAGKKANQVKGILEKAVNEALHRLEAGTRAIEDPDFLRGAAARFPGSLILGLILTRINWRKKRDSWGDSF